MEKTRNRFLQILIAAIAMVMIALLMPKTTFAASSTVSFTAIDGTRDSRSDQNEDYHKLVDGDTGESNRKWCLESFDPGTYVVIKAGAPINVTAYTLTTGNDNSRWHGRNPKSWTLYGSGDYDESTNGGTWVVLDSVTDDTTMQDEDNASYTFSVSGNSAYYQYYKLAITAIQGGSENANMVMQLGELGFTYTTQDNTTYYSVTYKDGLGGELFLNQSYTAAEGGAFPAFQGSNGTTAPTRSGYEFEGWKKEGENENYDIPTTVTENVTLVARWGLSRTPGPLPSTGAKELMSSIQNGELQAGEYYLDRDVTLTHSIDLTGDVTIDFRGHTLTYSGKYLSAIYMQGHSLTLKSSGSQGTFNVSDTEDQMCTISGNSRLTVENMTSNTSIRCVESNAGITIGSGTDISFEWIYCPVENYGTLSSGTFFAAVTNHGTIKGGNFSGAVTNYGTIEGGSFSGAVTNYGIIKGGNFSGTVNNEAGGTISEGTFSGTVINEGTITGGTFTGSRPAFTPAEGYHISSVNGDSGPWIVKANNNYTVKFSVNDGVGTAPASITAVYGEDFRLPSADGLSKTGFRFGGWNTAADGSGITYTAGSEERNLTETEGAEITLYAVWSKNVHTVTYSYIDAPDGAPALPNAASAAYNETVAVDDNPVLPGYTFSGWSSSDVTVNSDGTFVMPDKDVTFTGSWTKNAVIVVNPTYTVTAPTTTENGSVSVSPKTATVGSTVTITVAPDKGYTLETLIVKDAFNREVTVQKSAENTYTFRMPSSRVTVTASFMEDNTHLNYFLDVEPTDYSFDAVLWGYQNRIVKGTSDVDFSPKDPVTRAQFVTFLYRLAQQSSGFKEGTASTGFTDTGKLSDEFQKAIAWGKANQIVFGTSDTTFEPEKTVTREQAATFLHRYFESTLSAGSEKKNFSDVDKTAYYADAITWGSSNGVIEGYGDTFGVGDDTTREQAVTFIWRASVR